MHTVPFLGFFKLNENKNNTILPDMTIFESSYFLKTLDHLFLTNLEY